MPNPDTNSETDSGRLPATHGSAWINITDAMPAPGDIIACCAEHRDGGLMYWAGTVTAVEPEFARMERRGDRTERFIITHDTFWMRLPDPPNNTISEPESGGGGIP